MRHKRSLALLTLLSLVPMGLWADNEDISVDDPTSQSGVIINRYLKATQVLDSYKPDSMEVDIDANVPRLNEHGRLRALRMISAVGRITYRVLGFQGDNTVKSQVIARYLQAEQQGQNKKDLELNPVNYKFKFKGQKMASTGDSVYVFQVTPRAKRVGLFKGEMWLDAKTYLPVVEKGRLVKNPSIFFRKVDFERDFAILNGAAVPAHLSSTIDTRLVGKVNLNIAYSSPTVPIAKVGSEGAAPVELNGQTRAVSASYLP